MIHELVHVERREQGVSGPYTRTDAACGDHDDGGGNDGWKRGTPASSAPLMMNLYRRVRHAAQTTFFPAGYPQSVSHNYVAYVGWQGVQHMTSAANGSLASAFMLYAAGMGSASALPTAGAVNWVLKDGVGQIGTMVFARWMSRDFDSSARLWYCIAALKLNIAVWIETATFMFPSHFVAMGALANGLKGLSWMAGGATRSAFNVSFAKRENIADVTAKATSQAIVCSLVGTWTGLGVAAAIHQDVYAAAVVCTGLSSINIYAAYKSARKAPLRSLNPSRVTLLTQQAIDGIELCTPEDMSEMDTLCCRYDDPCIPLYSEPIERIAKLHGRYIRDIGEEYFAKKRYLLVSRGNRARPVAVLHEKASVEDVVEATALAVFLWRESLLDVLATGTVPAAHKEQVRLCFQRAEEMACEMMPELEKKGWDTVQVVEPIYSRAVWQ